MVRKATMQDEAAVRELIGMLVHETLDEELFRGIYIEMLESDDRYCWVFEDNGEVTGTLTLRIGSMLCRLGTISEIQELMVNPEKRSKGAGGQLIREAERITRERGCVRMEVSCSNYREDAHRFYEREGMVFTRRRYTKDM